MRKLAMLAGIGLAAIFVFGVAVWGITRKSVMQPVVEGIAQQTSKQVLQTPDGVARLWLDLIRTGDDVRAFNLLQMDDLSKGVVRSVVIGWRDRFGYRSAVLDGAIEQQGTTYRAPIRFVGDHGRDAGVNRCHTLTLAQDAMSTFKITNVEGRSCAGGTAIK